MVDGHSKVTVEVAGHLLECGPFVVAHEDLVVSFTVSGPSASPRLPKDHVAVFRLGDAEKLTSLGGYGGYKADGTAFFHWRFVWPGGTALRVVYVESGSRIVHEELVTL
jgi:hypothetical protein